MLNEFFGNLTHFNEWEWKIKIIMQERVHRLERNRRLCDISLNFMNRQKRRKSVEKIAIGRKLIESASEIYLKRLQKLKEELSSAKDTASPKLT